jgi:biopolymer transport protein ExbD
MKFKRRPKETGRLIDLTPIINVFFLLFIFFMFTSSFIFQPGIKVALPKAVTSDVIQEDGEVLIITKDDRLYMNEREVSTEEILSRLKIMARNKTALLIKADAKASLGRIVQIWDMCRREGVLQANIATSE